jgi:succinyl-diaminopimelate desuccinylase
MSTAVDLLVDLIQMNTVGAGEGVGARLCASLLDQAGLRTELIKFEPGREQLLATTSHDSGQAPLTLTGHMDTVPVDVEDWTVDPWSAERDGDRIIGRGTSDMKSGVAAALIAVTEHAARPHRCRGVQVVLTSGEETGCEGAMQFPRTALRTGGPLIVAEPTSNALVPAHKGALWLKLTASGVAAHGSSPELGDNAAVRMARAAVALHDYDSWPSEKGFGAVTANVGLLRGGVQPNVVPAAAELLLDIRTVPAVDPADLRSLVGELAGEKVSVADYRVLAPVNTSVDDPFVALVSESLSAVGLNGKVAPPARFFTDASALVPLLAEDSGGSLSSSVPTVILGPGEPEQCHVANEWCSMQRVDMATAVYGEILDRWCAGRH